MRGRERRKRRKIVHHTINSNDFERSTLPLSWSSTSLICPWTNHHDEQRICVKHSWSWTKSIDSSTRLFRNNQQILFHPRLSSSTEVILADRPLPTNGQFYWEIFMPAIYGTSMMFGIATKEQKLISSDFCHLIGIDQNGWALSHQGFLWHNGISRRYLTKSIDLLEPVLIGLEFDADARTLSYYLNNHYLGIAFDSIPERSPIYPAVSSTSAQSTMILKHSCRICSSLRDICLKRIHCTKSLNYQILPQHLVKTVNRFVFKGLY